MSDQKRLSCKRCQARKIKCSRLQPCNNCSQVGTACEYRHIDVRRRPVAQTYLTALESRLAWYEKCFQTLKASSDAERNRILQEINFEDHLESLPEASDDKPIPEVPGDHESRLGNAVALLPGPSGTLQFHGPTSMYLEDTSRYNSTPPNTSLGPSVQSSSIMRLGMNLGIDNHLVQTCIRNFFVYEYCRCMFVYREAFLEDYFDNAYGGKYCSQPLVYAVCALGATRSSDPSVRSKAQLLAKCAQEAILTHCLDSPTITTVQALLCIAFHELGQGSASLGWLFSGMAFRMGQELGFHQDPKTWLHSDRTITTDKDIEIRRRVYWGCFVADKYISLFLGRPVFLTDNDAAVVPSEPLPDFPNDYPWYGLGNIRSDESSSVIDERPTLMLALKCSVGLSEILHDAMTNIFSSKGLRKAPAVMSSALGELNLRLNRWLAGLPEPLQWSQWTRKGKTLRRHVLELHLFYHSIVLSLNRHFLPGAHQFTVHQPSESACAASCEHVIAMLRQFRQEHGSDETSLMMIYAVVLTAVILATSSSQSNALSAQSDPSLSFCMKVLQDASETFKLANEAHARLKVKLQSKSTTTSSDMKDRPQRPDSTQDMPSHDMDLSSQPTDELFSELFGTTAGLGVGTGTEAATDSIGTPSAGFAEAPAESLPDFGTMSNLDMFSMLMQDDSADPTHGDFTGWFSGSFT